METVTNHKPIYALGLKSSEEKVKPNRLS